MISITERTKCTGCSACYSVCPFDAITMQSDSEGFLRPEIDVNKCTECKTCVKTCPVNGITEGAFEPVLYGAYSTTFNLKHSTSGGIFTLLAKEVFKKGGVVFGAAFSKDFKKVSHIFAKNEEELLKLNGAKYLQSDKENSYKLVKEFLESGTHVLFSGTPCEVYGLKAYLKKDYENLFLVDLICHGVPSPKVWDNYLTGIEKRYNKKAVNVSFRDKTNGWEAYRVKVDFDGAEFSEQMGSNLYMKGFLKNLYLRPSCSDCRFKFNNRASDITLGDFWGVDKVCPKIKNYNGTSLLIVNGKKGEEMLAKIESDIKIIKVDGEKALSFNSSYYQSSVPFNREKFFKVFNKKGTESAVIKATQISGIKAFLIKVKNKLSKKD